MHFQVNHTSSRTFQIINQEFEEQHQRHLQRRKKRADANLFRHKQDLLHLLSKPVEDVMKIFEDECKRESRIVLFGIAIDKCNVAKASFSGLYYEYETTVQVLARDNSSSTIILVTSINDEDSIGSFFPLLQGTRVGRVYGKLDKLVISTHNSTVYSSGITLYGSIDVHKQVPELKGAIVAPKRTKISLYLNGSTNVGDVKIQNRVFVSMYLPRINFKPSLQCRNMTMMIGSRVPALTLHGPCTRAELHFSSSIEVRSGKNISIHGLIQHPVHNLLNLTGLQTNLAEINGYAAKGRLKTLYIHASAQYRERAVELDCDALGNALRLKFSNMHLQTLLGFLQLEYEAPDISLDNIQVVFQLNGAAFEIDFEAQTTVSVGSMLLHERAVFQPRNESLRMSMQLKKALQLGDLLIKDLVVSQSFSKYVEERKIVLNGTIPFWNYNSLRIYGNVTEGGSCYSVLGLFPAEFHLIKSLPELSNTCFKHISLSDSTLYITNGCGQKPIVLLKSRMQFNASKVFQFMQLFGNRTYEAQVALGSGITAIIPSRITVNSTVEFDKLEYEHFTFYGPMKIQIRIATAYISGKLLIGLKIPAENRLIQLSSTIIFEPRKGYVVGESVHHWTEPFEIKGIYVSDMIAKLNLDYETRIATNLEVKAYMKLPGLDIAPCIANIEYENDVMLLKTTIKRLPMAVFYKLMEYEGVKPIQLLPDMEWKDSIVEISSNEVHTKGLLLNGKLSMFDNSIHATATLNPKHGFSIAAKAKNFMLGPLEFEASDIRIDSTANVHTFSFHATLNFASILQIHQQVNISLHQDVLSFAIDNFFFNATVFGNLNSLHNIMVIGSLKSSIVTQVHKVLTSSIASISAELKKSASDCAMARQHLQTLQENFATIKPTSYCRHLPSSYEDMSYVEKKDAIRAFEKAPKRKRSSDSECTSILRHAKTAIKTISIATREARIVCNKTKTMAKQYRQEYLDNDLSILAMDFRAQVRHLQKYGKLSMRVTVRSGETMARRVTITVTDTQHVTQMAKSLVQRLVKQR